MASSSSFCPLCGAVYQPQDAFCTACGHLLQAADTSDLAHTTGRLFSNHFLKQRYRILESVGKGGMGAVYQAEDTQLGNRKVAVKEMSQSHLKPQEIEEAAEAFKQEAHLLAGLQHPHLPNVYEHFFEDGRWYLVMSFIQGETLEDSLARAPGGTLAVAEVLKIGIQLCAVLHYLHMQQPPIIFRDLKPSNVMLTQDRQLYLIDFGIARHFKVMQARDTAVYGSSGYSPPEQYGKAQTTPQSDIYSLGALLHQMLSGNDPAENPFHFAPVPKQEEPALAELTALIMSMVEMDAQKRPASMDAIKQSLERIAGRRQPVLNASQRQNQQVEQNQRPGITPPERRRALYPQFSERASQPEVYAVQQEERPYVPGQIYQSMPQYVSLPQLLMQRPSRDGLVIAGFVCGIIGIFTDWILIGLPLSIIGLVLSAVGMHFSEKKGLALAGLLLSLLGILIAVVVFVAVIMLNL